MKIINLKFFWLPEITGHLKYRKGVPDKTTLNDINDLGNNKPIYTSFGKKLLYIDEGLLNYYSDEQSQDQYQPEFGFLVEVEFVKTDINKNFPHQYKFSPKAKFNGSDLEYLRDISSARTYDFFRMKTQKGLLVK